MNSDVWALIARSSDFETASNIRLVEKDLIGKDVLLEVLAVERRRDQHLVDFATREKGDLSQDEMRTLVAADATAWATCVYLFSDNSSSYFAFDAGATRGDASAFMDKTALCDKTLPPWTHKSCLKPSFSAASERLHFDTPPKLRERVLIARLKGDDRVHVYRIATHVRLWKAVMAAVDRLSRRKKLKCTH